MEITELPMVTEVRPLQLEKAELPMNVTELGMVTEVRPERLQQQYAGTYLTLSPKTKLVRLEQFPNGRPYESKSLQLSALKCTDEKLLHPSNAFSPIEVTVLGMVTEVRPERL